MTEPEYIVPSLDAEHVAKRFGAVVALVNASLRVNPGEIVALMGANGAGKSTFVKILTGALKADAAKCALRGGKPKLHLPRWRGGRVSCPSIKSHHLFLTFRFLTTCVWAMRRSNLFNIGCTSLG